MILAVLFGLALFFGNGCKGCQHQAQNKGVQARPHQIRIVVTGDTGASGIGVYRNGQKDNVLDYYNMMEDPQERVVLTTADGQMFQMIWKQEFNGFVATFPPLQGNQPFYFAVQHPSREPTAPANWLDPVYGIYADVVSANGQILSTTELVHYENREYPLSNGPQVESVKPVWSVVIDYVNMQTGQIHQGEDNRIAEITISGEETQ